jgi:hypothetical protein
MKNSKITTLLIFFLVIYLIILFNTNNIITNPTVKNYTSIREIRGYGILPGKLIKIRGQITKVEGSGKPVKIEGVRLGRDSGSWFTVEGYKLQISNVKEGSITVFIKPESENFSKLTDSLGDWITIQGYKSYGGLDHWANRYLEEAIILSYDKNWSFSKLDHQKGSFEELDTFMYENLNTEKGDIFQKNVVQAYISPNTSSNVVLSADNSLRISNYFTFSFFDFPYSQKDLKSQSFYIEFEIPFRSLWTGGSGVQNHIIIKNYNILNKPINE